MPGGASTVGERSGLRWRCAAALGAVALATAASLAAAAWAGWEGRVFAPRRHVMVREGHRNVLDAWRDLGVHGRILVHLDRRLAMSDEPGEVTEENVLHRAAAANLVRKIFHVLPDDAWPKASERLRTMPAVARRGDTFRLTVEDVPVVVSRARDLPALDEPALVSIDATAWSAPEVDRLVERLRSGALDSDVIVVHGAGAAELAQRIRGGR